MDEFNGFGDFITSFPIYRGRAKSREEEADTIVGELKVGDVFNHVIKHKRENNRNRSTNTWFISIEVIAVLIFIYLYCVYLFIFQLSKVESNPELLRFCFAMFCDWFKNSCYLLNQSDTKPKPIVTWAHAFTRALSLLVYLLIVFYTLVVIGHCNCYGFTTAL